MIATDSPKASNLDLAALTLDDLASLSNPELTALYARAATPRIADLQGPLNGLVLGPQVNPEKVNQLWKGKVFHPLGPDRGAGINRMDSAGVPAPEYEFVFSIRPSLHGDGDVVVLDYDLPVNPSQVRAVLDELKQLNDHLFLGIANQKTADGYKPLLYFALQFPCPASARLKTGPGDDGYYRTLAPFEHFNSLRTLRFPHTCPVETLANSTDVRVVTRDSVSDWRVSLQAPTKRHWNYPGGLAVHANGRLYAVAGNLLARVDAATAEHRIVPLPEHPG